MTRRSTLERIAMLCLIASLGYALDRGQLYGNDENVAQPAGGKEGSGLRLREGMKFVDQVGELKEAGGSIVFYPEGQTHALQLLQNLALERVANELDQSQRQWSVTGIVTEYRGGNYLLLERAVRRARASNLPSSRS